LNPDTIAAKFRTQHEEQMAHWADMELTPERWEALIKADEQRARDKVTKKPKPWED
jgi:hypothetical protein